MQKKDDKKVEKKDDKKDDKKKDDKKDEKKTELTKVKVESPPRRVRYVFPYDQNPKNTMKPPFTAWNSDQWWNSNEEQWKKDVPPGYPPAPYGDDKK